jgi:hypothetical protein
MLGPARRKTIDGFTPLRLEWASLRNLKLCCSTGKTDFPLDGEHL